MSSSKCDSFINVKIKAVVAILRLFNFLIKILCSFFERLQNRLYFNGGGFQHNFLLEHIKENFQRTEKN